MMGLERTNKTFLKVCGSNLVKIWRWLHEAKQLGGGEKRFLSNLQ